MSIYRSLPLMLALLAGTALAQPVPTLRIAVNRPVARVSPSLYGLMTEEINFAYEGGLYGELLRNRSFKAQLGYAYSNDQPVYWDPIGPVHIALDHDQPLNAALTVSLHLDARDASAATPAGVSNQGYWGIPVLPNTAYRVSFYARADRSTGPITVAIGKQGAGPAATAIVGGIGTGWRTVEAVLRTGAVPASKDNVFTLTTTTPGQIWLQQVSLFPPTYKDRANGNRRDLMTMLGAMKPSFLRLPGGNYLEGDTFEQRFDWKKTIGDTAERPGHRSPWNYWSTDGLGLLEYLNWCEDLGMEPVLAVFAGYALHGEHVSTASELAPLVQDALDEIDYVTGDVSTPWGARRARDGHPRPFALRYVEIGNEDYFDRANTYDTRFSTFYRAIKAKHPQLQLISTMKLEATPSQRPDVLDEHLYPESEGEMEARAHEFDTRPRNGPKVLVGEWATRIGTPTTNMAAALADAAYMTGMERNADLVVLASYAPLQVNVSDVSSRGKDRSMQWRSDLIGYDALTSYGSPSYYAQKMFSEQRGDVVLTTAADNVPTWTWHPEPKKRNGVLQPAAPAQELPSLYWVATREEKNGHVLLKLVNRSATPQPLHVALTGVRSVAATGTLTTLAGNGQDATNSITDPRHVVPNTQKVTGLARDFTRTLPAYSISVLDMAAR